MASNPLIIGHTQKAELTALRERARQLPFDVNEIIQQCRSTGGSMRHLAAMRQFSIELPTNFFVTFSHETGHPVGLCRHLSVSSHNHGRVPSPAAVWLIAQELGFSGSFNECQVWLEPIGEGDMAINVAQPVPS